jgi:class 3 adenylate cyclase
MARADRSALPIHAVEAVYSLVILAWYFLPLFLSVEGLFPVPLVPFQLYEGPPVQLGRLIATAVVVYLVPLICLFKIASVFLDSYIPSFTSPLRSFPLVLDILNSGFVAAVIVTHTIVFAHNSRYFQVSSPFTYVVFLLSIAYNAYFIYLLIVSVNKREDSYREYLEFRRSTNGHAANALSVLARPGIQRRLIFSFIPLILVIVVVLSFVLMRDFSNTILASVIQDGKNLAERAASVIRANPADMIGADDYLSLEAKRNAASAFPFKTIFYRQKDPRADAFTVEASTDRTLIGQRISLKVEPFREAVTRYDAARKLFEFLGPVSLAGKFLGYVTVEYDRNVIYEPYFRTQVKAFTIAVIFIYASVFLIYLLGRNIVFPILFLRMSVSAISGALTRMIKRESRISADLLQYKDRVVTRDEIKSLSNEIGNMTAVIRGIVPYISASTLEHAERENPTTEMKELTFLFTDIRGFTTLCEGMSPERIVEMLNHFLDMQSSVVYANGGDVDKFVGDEVMAMFDGPDKEQKACKTSMEIRKVMAQEKELAQAAQQNIIAIGIGINTGDVVFGSVGSKDRMDFTSIGDTVNLAARLEGANKPYGTKTLITESVFEKVKDIYLCREIDMLTVKGKQRPVRIYELLQRHEDAAQRLVDMKRIFEEGLDFYRRQKWPSAVKAFETLRERMKDETSAVFLKRIEYFKTNPPPRNWDGVFNLTVK